MAEQGVTNLLIRRQDSYDQMNADLVALATAMSHGEANPDEGVHFVAIMGDGAAAFLQGLNPVLERIGPDYQAEIIGSMGYSRGEDKCMGPSRAIGNPAALRGLTFAVYLRDGDWNILVKLANDNGIPVNPDETTFDPNAINVMAADDYLHAATLYNTNASENRPVVENGRRTGRSQTVHADGVCTWTPGDVNIARGRGGLVSLASTYEYSEQMPNTLIGIRRWNRENSALVEGMLTAIFMAGDQVKTSPQALQRAAEISAVVYNEEDAAYWLRYFNRVTETDSTGLSVSLGGSYVNNYADNQQLFGLLPGSTNRFAIVYRAFGDIVVRMYPNLVSSYPPVNDVVNTTYLRNIAPRFAQVATAPVETPRFEMAPSRESQVVARRNWSIQFQTGSATFTPEAIATLQELCDGLTVASNLAVEVHGHTDNAGGNDANMELSESRAFAVRTWLQQNAPDIFPDGRIRVYPHGEEQPIAPNSNEEGRARNRRVEIVMRENR